VHEVTLGVNQVHQKGLHLCVGCHWEMLPCSLVAKVQSLGEWGCLVEGTSCECLACLVRKVLHLLAGVEHIGGTAACWQGRSRGWRAGACQCCWTVALSAQGVWQVQS